MSSGTYTEKQLKDIGTFSICLSDAIRLNNQLQNGSMSRTNPEHNALFEKAKDMILSWCNAFMFKQELGVCGLQFTMNLYKRNQKGDLFIQYFTGLPNGEGINFLVQHTKTSMVELKCQSTEEYLKKAKEYNEKNGTSHGKYVFLGLGNGDSDGINMPGKLWKAFEKIKKGKVKVIIICFVITCILLDAH